MTINIKEERELVPSQKVEVYRNLHVGKFSIRDRKSKLVVAHGEHFVIENVVPKISESGRIRVHNEKHKNVHSVLQGEYVGFASVDTSGLDELYYNPYTLDSFINKRTGEVVNSVGKVYFEDNKAWILE